MKRVLFGSIHDKFSLKTHIPFGPWCFIGQENEVDSEKYKFPDDAFQTKEEFKIAEQHVASVINFLFPKLCQYLNQINHTNRSHNFWRIMIMPWLSLFVQNIISNYYRLRKFLKRHGTDFIFECSPNTTWTFNNTYDFIVNGIESADYNEWIYSRIIKNCNPNLKTEYILQRVYETSQPIIKRNNLKFKIKYFVKNLIAIKSVYGINFLNAILLSFSIKRGKFSQTKDDIKIDPLSPTFLQEIDWEAFSKECLPVCFENIRRISTHLFSPNYHFQILSGSLLYTEEEQKYQLASYVEKGGTIIPCQHGSNYGVLATFLTVKHIEYSHKHYFSWGWTTHQNSREKAIPLPAPLIEKFKAKHVTEKKNTEILLIGTTTKPFYLDIGTFHQPNQIIEYRLDKLTFLSSLTHNCYKRLKYRYYPVNNTQLADKEFVHKRFPDIQFCEGELHPQMGKAALVVSDHPGTTFNLTMGANVPTIGFWNPEHWGFTEEAEKLFFELKQQNIIFETPKSAAEHINQIVGNISEWWESPNVQKSRLAWCEKYAHISKNWKEEWKKAIKKLNEEIIPH